MRILGVWIREGYCELPKEEVVDVMRSSIFFFIYIWIFIRQRFAAFFLQSSVLHALFSLAIGFVASLVRSDKFLTM